MCFFKKFNLSAFLITDYFLKKKQKEKSLTLVNLSFEKIKVKKLYSNKNYIYVLIFIKLMKNLKDLATKYMLKMSLKLKKNV